MENKEIIEVVKKETIKMKRKEIIKEVERKINILERILELEKTQLEPKKFYEGSLFELKEVLDMLKKKTTNTL